MRTLAPTQTFLRVTDKFFPDFVLEDRHLCTGATLLYLYLFRLAGQKDCCWPSQAALARACKASVRSVQGYINRLADRGYIQVEREGTHNVYRLLLSARVQAMIQLVGSDMLSAVPHAGQETAISPPPDSPSTTPLQNTFEHTPSALPIANGANTAPSDTQILQRQGANSAHYIRQYKDNISPLSPLSSPNSTPRPVPCAAGGVSLSAVPAHIEKGRPACEARDAKIEFEALFASWPRKQDKLQAERTYAKMVRAGQLPPLQSLLDVVARFKAEDRAWRNGFAPNLRFWLLGKRWQDEITPAAPSVALCVPPSRAPSPLPPEVIAHAQKLYAIREEHGSAVLSDARKEVRPQTSLAKAADALCCLWPHEDRGKIMSCLVLANIRGVSSDSVVSKAQQAGQRLMLPVETWFRQVAA